MPTLITFTNRKGTYRCGESCYMATDDKCKCKACGGMNHGIGLKKATANTEQMAKLLAEGQKNSKGRKFNCQEDMFV
jgi:hypothetical protein